jgi:hypothetical protein
MATTTVAPNLHDNDDGPHLQHQPIPNPKPPQRVKAATAAAAAGARDAEMQHRQGLKLLSWTLTPQRTR